MRRNNNSSRIYGGSPFDSIPIMTYIYILGAILLVQTIAIVFLNGKASSNSKEVASALLQVQSTIGPKGDTGEQGIAGTNGKNGTDGTNGTNGKNGTNGTDGGGGQAGSKGPRGEQGSIGPPGDCNNCIRRNEDITDNQINAVKKFSLSGNTVKVNNLESTGLLTFNQLKARQDATIVSRVQDEGGWMETDNSN